MYGAMTIWWLSILLVAAAVAWMLQLIAARRIRESMDRRRVAERRVLQGALLGLAAGEEEAVAVLSSARGARAVAEPLAALTDMLQGEEVERVAAALRRTHLHQRLLQGARRGRRRNRLVCLEALKVFPGEDTCAVLKPISLEPDPAISLGAYKTLWALGEDLSLADIGRDAYRPEGRTLDRLDLAGRIARRHPDQAVEYVLDPKVSEVVRLKLIESIAESGRSEMIAPLMALSQIEDHPRVRAAALRALGRFTYCYADEVLSDALSSRHWEVRSEAANTVALCKASSQVNRLADLLDDDVWIVRYNAGRALSRMAATGRRKLRQVVENGPERPRRVASFILAGGAG